MTDWGDEAAAGRRPDPSKARPFNGKSASKEEPVTMSMVEPEEIEWHWVGYLAAHKLNLIEGDPGEGKSTLSIEIAARLSRGEAICPEEGDREPIDVLLISAEDGLADTMSPRLRAAGADLGRVHGVGPELASKLRLDAAGFELLEQWIDSKQASCVVLDPLSAFLPRDIDAHKDQDIRSVLGMVSSLCERKGVTFIVVRHLTKQVGVKAIYRGGGSIGIGGAARSVLLVARDPQDPEARVLCSVKVNNARKPSALRFHLESMGAVAKVVWDGTANLDADEAVEPPPRAKQKNGAAEWILARLAGGPVLGTVLLADAQKAGHGKVTFERARAELNKAGRIENLRPTPSGPIAWRLATSSTPPPAQGSDEGAEHDEGDEVGGGATSSTSPPSSTSSLLGARGRVDEVGVTKVDAAKQWILARVPKGVAELRKQAVDSGIPRTTFERAAKELRDAGRITTLQKDGSRAVWFPGAAYKEAGAL